VIAGQSDINASEPKKTRTPPPKAPAPKAHPPAHKARQPGNAGLATKVLTDLAIIGELRHAHAVLVAANGEYHGHRKSALQHINFAIGHLEKEIHAGGLKESSKHVRDVPRIISDALLVQSARNLEVIHRHLGAARGSPNRHAAAADLVKAHGQIVRALIYSAHTAPRIGKSLKAAGVWLHKPGAAVAGEITLHTNGRINKAEGHNTWLFDGTTLILIWPNSAAPGGAWIDVVRVSTNGRAYLGQNQIGTIIAGEKVRNALK